MTPGSPLGPVFTGSGAVELFREATGFEFHPTVPGQLLVRRGIKKLNAPKFKQGLYESKHWPQLWLDMLALASRRCSYDATLAPPRDVEPPPAPLHKPQ